MQKAMNSISFHDSSFKAGSDYSLCLKHPEICDRLLLNVRSVQLHIITLSLVMRKDHRKERVMNSGNSASFFIKLS